MLLMQRRFLFVEFCRGSQMNPGLRGFELKLVQTPFDTRVRALELQQVQIVQILSDTGEITGEIRSAFYSEALASCYLGNRLREVAVSLAKSLRSAVLQRRQIQEIDCGI